MIVASLEDSATYPVSVDVLHALAYYVDALSHVWGLEPVNDTVLKKAGAPTSPELQASIDALVGRGMLEAVDIKYSQASGRVTLAAKYKLNRALCGSVLALFTDDAYWKMRYTVVREICLAMRGMGADRVAASTQFDASYGDPAIGAENVLDLEPDEGAQPSGTQLASRTLVRLAKAEAGVLLDPSEITQLYARHIFSLLREDQ